MSLQLRVLSFHRVDLVQFGESVPGYFLVENPLIPSSKVNTIYGSSNDGYATYGSLPLRLQATCTLSMAWLGMGPVGTWFWNSATL